MIDMLRIMLPADKMFYLRVGGVYERTKACDNITPFTVIVLVVVSSRYSMELIMTGWQKARRDFYYNEYDDRKQDKVCFRTPIQGTHIYPMRCFLTGRFKNIQEYKMSIYDT